ncbi:hypothetical protein LOZ04_002493 [Ophidiomyces ophidiicola]|nr:hypothetical protein LOZ56_006498 [Ophidiomyces ophidiicola]KAI2024614.1 hypothetical protein LOZ45_003590 [Ophidiomyces ophidiicola]KAI2155962.1 hypothetical protein LOZ25_004334 [Ophidiomyces ophidiicola]KAI2213186.1 hypothetical protein LOZ17_005321 [Ophidiomyces ophidiicola]KAI2230176.1 hypothetical protein LOZ14_006072 [Ophidiomyces ophidiicola]
MGRPKFCDNWIGTMWDNERITCPDGTVWQVGKKISEKSLLAPDLSDGKHPTEAEAQAVYHCTQVLPGKSPQQRAIMKVRMQVPPTNIPDLNPLARTKIGQEQPAFWTRFEVHALQHFNKKKCKSVPQLLNLVVTLQHGSHMPVPSGSLVFLIMEELPGVPLTGFWKYDRPKRDKIRASFRRSLEELFNVHGYPADYRLDNLIYDESTDMCYFVDFEETWVTESKPIMKFSNYYYFLWGLAHSENGKDIY